MASATFFNNDENIRYFLVETELSLHLFGYLYCHGRVHSCSAFCRLYVTFAKKRENVV